MSMQPKPVSRFYWRLRDFEWVPMPGKLGVKPRNWHGKTIHKLNP